MKKITGVFTALITPFQRGEVDFDSLRSLLRKQLDEGIQGFVVNGTTAESPCLSADERVEIFNYVKTEVAGQVPVIMGTGTNSTAETVSRTEEAAKLGAQAALVVVPYYNKPPQQGLFAHFKSVAEHAQIPVILYNVPSRTIARLEIDTILRLSKEKNIIGIKEASGDIHFATKIKAGAPKEFSLLSGDDASFAHFLNAGGDGIISVGSHIFAKEFVALQSREQGADKRFEARLETINNLYLEANPIPVKMALYLMGVIKSPEMRLPLTTMSEELLPKLKNSMTESGLI